MQGAVNVGDRENKKDDIGIFSMPKTVPAILLNIFLERFSTTAISGNFEKRCQVNISLKIIIITAILVLYLNRKLNFDPSLSTALYHTNELLAYGFTIVGAIIADSWWGHFKTILWMSLIFAVGSFILTIGSIEQLSLPTVYDTLTKALHSFMLKYLQGIYVYWLVDCRCWIWRYES